jgi:CHAT domain-containing protein
MGREVLKARFRALRSPALLHVATHGFFLADQRGLRSAPGANALRVENPLLRSGLLLAGFNAWLAGAAAGPDTEDGILNAEDVSGLDLVDTELTVLSACETGLGEVLVGEGVFGLRRAFELAGARTVVMSLWKVPDQQTVKLMGQFYRGILAGRPRAEALREAQLAVKALYPQPVHWAAFICQGDPRPLRWSPPAGAADGPKPDGAG